MTLQELVEQLEAETIEHGRPTDATVKGNLDMILENYFDKLPMVLEPETQVTLTEILESEEYKEEVNAFFEQKKAEVKAFVDETRAELLDENSEVSEAKKFGAIEGANLLNMDLPPIKFFVEGLLSQGLGLLTAKSKLGKSWLALQLAVSLINGEKFLGFTTNQCGVLYIDLENAKPLSQERFRLVLNGADVPQGQIYFTYEAPRIGDGFEDALIDFLRNHQNIKVVIIDVLQKIKPIKKHMQTDYEADYITQASLKGIADEFSICVLAVHHERKMVDSDDPFANVLGSTALVGVSDFVWSLAKEKRTDPEATFSVTGRTLLEQQYKLKKSGVLWENLGDAETIEAARKQEQYNNDPIVRTIRYLIADNGGKWRGRISELIEASKRYKGCRIYGTPQKVSSQLKKLEADLYKYDEIQHWEMSNGSGSKNHIYESKNPFIKSS